MLGKKPVEEIGASHPEVCQRVTQLIFRHPDPCSLSLQRITLFAEGPNDSRLLRETNAISFQKCVEEPAARLAIV